MNQAADFRKDTAKRFSLNEMIMVGAEGFEPPTLWSQTRCATRLRYAPTRFSLSHRADYSDQSVRKRP
jgi:hypothetical protein